MSTKSNATIATMGIDIGKNSFHVVGLDRRGAIVVRQKWSRSQVEARLAAMPPCLIGMEACVGAHHLSRKLQALGHDARLMPAKYVRAELPGILATRTDVLSPRMMRLIEGLAGDWRRLDERVEGLSTDIANLVAQDPACERLMTVPGIGPIISSATVAAIGTGDVFSKGRDFAAWLGLVPRQFSTGDRTILGKISKRGNRYLAVIRNLSQKRNWVELPLPGIGGYGRQGWLSRLIGGGWSIGEMRGAGRVSANCHFHAMTDMPTRRWPDSMSRILSACTTCSAIPRSRQRIVVTTAVSRDGYYANAWEVRAANHGSSTGEDTGIRFRVLGP